MTDHVYMIEDRSGWRFGRAFKEHDDAKAMLSDLGGTGRWDPPTRKTQYAQYSPDYEIVVVSAKWADRAIARNANEWFLPE